MPKFLIDATVYATVEYSNQVEIEANSAEDAGQIFEERAAQHASGYIDLSDPVDAPFNIEGSYKIIAMPENTVADDVIDDEPALEDMGFTGPA